MAGTRSFGVSPPCSMRNLIASTGIGQVDGEMSGLIRFDQGQQYLEALPLRRAGLRLVVEIRRHLAQGGLVVGVGANPADFHVSTHIAAHKRRSRQSEAVDLLKVWRRPNVAVEL